MHDFPQVRQSRLLHLQNRFRSKSAILLSMAFSATLAMHAAAEAAPSEHAKVGDCGTLDHDVQLAISKLDDAHDMPLPEDMEFEAFASDKANARILPPFFTLTKLFTDPIPHPETLCAVAPIDRLALNQETLLTAAIETQNRVLIALAINVVKNSKGNLSAPDHKPRPNSEGFPSVVALHMTNGRWDIIAELHAESLEAFERVLRGIRLLPGISQTETSILLSTHKL
jgi:DNA-binding Lrp family transcriptional regulator